MKLTKDEVFAMLAAGGHVVHSNGNSDMGNHRVRDFDKIKRPAVMSEPAGLVNSKEKAMRFAGYRYDVTVYAFYKVAIAKTENEDEIYENAFMATKDIFKGWSEVKTIDNDVQGVDQSNKYFTIVDFSWELKVTVTSHDIDDAFGDAEGFVKDADLPNGVVMWEAEAIDGERDTQECWID